MDAYLLTIMGLPSTHHLHAYLQTDKEQILDITRNQLVVLFGEAGGQLIGALLETKLDTGRDTIRAMLRRRAPDETANLPPRSKFAVVFFCTRTDDPDDHVLMEIH